MLEQVEEGVKEAAMVMEVLEAQKMEAAMMMEVLEVQKMNRLLMKEEVTQENAVLVKLSLRVVVIAEFQQELARVIDTGAAGVAAKTRAHAHQVSPNLKAVV